MERPPIWVMVTMFGGLLMITVGLLYYTFIGPHPDASGSIQENVLNPLFWTDHPGIALIMLGGILVIVAIRFSRTGRSSS